VPVGQESPTRGMGVWAVEETATKKIRVINNGVRKNCLFIETPHVL